MNKKWSTNQTYFSFKALQTPKPVLKLQSPQRVSMYLCLSQSHKKVSHKASDSLSLSLSLSLCPLTGLLKTYIFKTEPEFCIVFHLHERDSTFSEEVLQTGAKCGLCGDCFQLLFWFAAGIYGSMLLSYWPIISVIKEVSVSLTGWDTDVFEIGFWTIVEVDGSKYYVVYTVWGCVCCRTLDYTEEVDEQCQIGSQKEAKTHQP